MSDDRSTRIRLGLILQGCVEEALKSTSFSTYVATPKYDDESMTPDFLIPNQESPKYFVEVTQTDTRDSFRRKTLRYFEAVCEAKAYLGSHVISVNILFGDPQRFLAKSNVDAMYGFFDVNVCPRNDVVSPDDRLKLDKLEVDALSAASDDSIDSVDRALLGVIRNNRSAIAILGQVLENALTCGAARTELFDVWDEERSRLTSVTTRPEPIKFAAPYKRAILECLLVSDEDFGKVSVATSLKELGTTLIRDLAGKKLLSAKKPHQRILRRLFHLPVSVIDKLFQARDPKSLETPIRNSLIATGLLEATTGAAGVITYTHSAAVGWLVGNMDQMPLDKNLLSIADDEYGQTIREICKVKLYAEPANRWFFEDIRSEGRRIEMVNKFLDTINRGPESLHNALGVCATDDAYDGIDHSRCWIADLMACHVGKSHNAFNNAMFSNPEYKGSIGNPFNFLTIKSRTLLGKAEVRDSVIKSALTAYYNFYSEQDSSVTNCGSLELATRLLTLRLDGLVSRHSLNPLELIINEICKSHGLSIGYGCVGSFISDASEAEDSAGQYRVYWIDHDYSRVLVNALYVDDYGGRDKAKEWSARGRSFLYGMENGTLIQQGYKGLIMILDGPWHPEAVLMLERGGWTTCRPSEFESVLCSMLAIVDTAADAGHG